jgi:L-threonylcarbamoyladenylate synthase
MADIGKDLGLAQKLLESSSVIAIPTETVYGLAGNALNRDAILSIYKIKNRPAFDPLIAHVASIDRIEEIATVESALVKKIGEAIWPGPLTMLLPRRDHLPDILTSGLPRVAVRIPRHPLTAELLQKLDFPLAAPSANPFGYVSPTTAQHVNQQLGDKIPYILDGGPTQVGLESTIIGFEGDQIIVHRLGGLKLEDLESFGHVKTVLNQSSNPTAPGMLKSHYSPGKKMIIGDLEELTKRHQNEKVGIISFNKSYPQAKVSVVLAPTGDPDEAARNLFSALRKMDDPEINLILAEFVPEEGLGRAVNDRLKRAAAK